MLRAVDVSAFDITGGGDGGVDDDAVTITQTARRRWHDHDTSCDTVPR